MLALAHAHGFSVFHSNLKPNKIMLSTEVHGHQDESDICVKIISWGCSDEEEGEIDHMFLPKMESGTLQPKSAKFDVYCVGQILRWLFSHRAPSRQFEGFQKELSNGEWQMLYGDKSPNPFAFDSFRCPWMADYPALPMIIRCPFNPIMDADIDHLLQGMLKANPDERFTVSQVLDHPFLVRPSAQGLLDRHEGIVIGGKFNFFEFQTCETINLCDKKVCSMNYVNDVFRYNVAHLSSAPNPTPHQHAAIAEERRHSAAVRQPGPIQAPEDDRLGKQGHAMWGGGDLR